jgi:glutamyl-Q tRNA(Asp) synthetase
MPLYRGRFAPSPTGPLHLGSLVAAVGSYLEAKHHQGLWLLRIEDLDTPRTVKGAADAILCTLEAFGLYWDEALLYQSQRTAAYEEALQKLQAIGAVYPCVCTRKEIADSALHGIEGMIYPGTCRNGIPAGREERAWRVRTDTPFPIPSPGGRRELDPLSHRGRAREGEGFIQFDDALQGLFTQHLKNEIGDFVVKRADGLFAYQLAAVVDDAFQGITHVVRGADLLSSTPRQIYLQRLQGLTTPAYMHLPVAINTQGEKLSKQTLAAPVDVHNTSSSLWRALEFLRQQPPAELASYKPEEILEWAIAHWDRDKLRGIMQIAV